eukprot:TRINITY_DN5543_c0_g1_i2.p1 TRINITY_DN5543_c0_g1~~TRINITY_DN5543_c0_g1_i2.p1  ORF type:complete len:527 (-),score=67.49 TRINITY_DN5543_c0_g1_i2:377-1957(-)
MSLLLAPSRGRVAQGNVLHATVSGMSPAASTRAEAQLLSPTGSPSTPGFVTNSPMAATAAAKTNAAPAATASVHVEQTSATAPQAPEVASAVQEQPAQHAGVAAWGEPDWMEPPRQLRRRTALGLEEPDVCAFWSECEFISLGSWCGTARALQGLGVKRYAYPFDWVRSPSDGIVHCLENDFEDFLTFTMAAPEGPGGEHTSYKNARWGGSFWHHDVQQPKIADDFSRRVERLLGLGEDVPWTKARIFVRVANSTKELYAAQKLYAALRKALPSAPLYLLIIVELQDWDGPMSLPYDQHETSTGGLLFYRLQGDLFGEHFTMQKVAENYSRAIASVIRIWAGVLCPYVAPSLDALVGSCEQMDGGSTAWESYWPRRFFGQRMPLRVAEPRLPTLLPEIAKASSLPAKEHLKESATSSNAFKGDAPTDGKSSSTQVAAPPAATARVVAAGAVSAATVMTTTAAVAATTAATTATAAAVLAGASYAQTASTELDKSVRSFDALNRSLKSGSNSVGARTMSTQRIRIFG